MRDKNTIRKTIIRKRNDIPEGYRIEANRIITQKLISMDFFRRAEAVMCYADICGEVETSQIIRYCIDNGKKLSLPKVLCKAEMYARTVTCPDSQLEKGKYGVMEPICALTTESEPGEIDVIIVPGVAFDRNLNRIGYGAGYYDNYLKKTGRKCLKVGLAFDVQITEHIPADETDEPVDLIITESEIIERLPDQAAIMRNGGIA